MWARVLILVVILTPILVGVVVGAMHWWKLYYSTKAENKALRQITDKTQDDRDWNNLFHDLEQRQYRTKNKEK